MTRGREPTPEEEAKDRERTKELIAEGKIAQPHDYTKQADRELALSKVFSDYEGFVFDEDKVLRNKDFHFCKLDKDTAGIGLFLPRNMTIKNKGGYITTQKNVPVFIYSKPAEKIRALLPLTADFENHIWKIKVSNIPDESVFPRRWNLTNIQHYLAGQYNGVSLSVIFEDLKATYKRFCFFENEAWYSIHAVWDMGTYFFKLFDYYPILELRGQMATGKTKIMAISRLYTFNPTQEMTNPSEATLFREGGKTQYLDEGEKIFYKNPKSGQMEGDTRAEIINSGFKRSGSVPRQEKSPDGKFRTINYSTYSPRMIASINGLFGATEDRSIIHTTTPAPKSDKRAELEPNEEDASYNKTICALHVALLENWPEIEYGYQNFQNTTKLKQRELNIWKPLLVLARLIDQDLYTRISEFAETLASVKKLNRLDENSLDFWVIKLALNQLEEQGAPLVLKDIPLGLPEQYAQYKPKTISRILERLGLYELKHRTNRGFVYQIGFSEFKSKVELFYPDFFSTLSTLSSLNREKELNPYVKESEETLVKVKEMTLEDYPKGEESVANEESVGKTSGEGGESTV